MRENDVLWRVAQRQASLMSPAELTRALSQRPVELRFVRGARSVAKDLAVSETQTPSGSVDMFIVTVTY